MDLVLVTYNSEKWIERCFSSIAQSDNIKEDLNIFVVDNGSTDKTLDYLRKFQHVGSHFHVVQQGENIGFGRANNIGAKMGLDDIICFINVDTEVFPDTFKCMLAEVELSADTVGAWEMRQFPYEHPKLYNPIDKTTSWMSGAAFAIRRVVFEQVGGFDEKIFMYAEDVDISWRIRDLGYTIHYCPKVRIIHYSYESINEIKPMQYIGSVKNNLLLRYRYGNISTILKGYFLYFQAMLLHRSPYKGAKYQLAKIFVSHWKDVPYFFRTKVKNKQVAQFLAWDYEVVRDGAFVAIEDSMTDKKVSVIVRTCQRPSVLRETLCSLRNQTYKNIEVVVVEDGEPSARDMLNKEFSDMNIIYAYTGERKGRSYAGNMALDLATGDYFNFLDDDDLFFSDHIESLMCAIRQTECKAAYAYSFETPIDVHDIEPYKYCVKRYAKRYTQEFDKILLCHHNYIPIQCIMFSRELYDRYGGFDTTLDYLEDWDLWVRYMQGTDYICVPKTTSIYRIPARKNVQDERQKKLDDALEIVRKKHQNYYITVPVSSMVKYGEENIWKIIQKRFKFNR